MDNQTRFVVAFTALDFLTYCLYNRKSWSKPSPTNRDLAPNPWLWGSWTFLSSLNASSYHVAGQSLLNAVLAYENAVMCFITLLIAIRRGIPQALSLRQRVSLILGVVAGFAWIYFKNAWDANFILQAGTLITMIGLCVDLWHNPKLEPTLPWGLWTIVYTLLTIKVYYFGWNGHWEKIVYPINYILVHLAVWAFTLRRRTPRALLHEGERPCVAVRTP